MNQLDKFIIKRVNEVFHEMYMNELEDNKKLIVTTSEFMQKLIDEETCLYVGDGLGKGNIDDEMEVLQLLALSSLSLQELVTSATRFFGKDNISMFLVINYMLEYETRDLIFNVPSAFGFIEG